MILILGGTYESLKIASKLDSLGLEYLITTTTDIQKNEIERISHKIFVVKFDEKSLANFVIQNKIDTIIDATHPFAVSIKKLAIDISKRIGLRYIRYEREKVELPRNKYVIKVDSLEEALKRVKNISGNIFVTTGVKELPFIYSFLDSRKDEIYVRVLPKSDSLKLCENIGISLSHIIAMVGPFDYEMNFYLINKYNIRVVISKESGTTGGLYEKIRSAIDNNIYIIIIKAPAIDYPVIVYTIDELVEVLDSCDRNIKSYKKI